jgi:hypothetical protein
MSVKAAFRRLLRILGIEYGIVEIALLASRIEGGRIGCIERCAAAQALDQVGIGDEELPGIGSSTALFCESGG